MQLFVWTGPNQPGSYHTGDIVEVLDDGVHPGRRVVSNASWDAACTLTNVGVIDLRNVSLGQIYSAWATAAGLPQAYLDHLHIRDFCSVNLTMLPTQARRALTEGRRAGVSPAQLVGAVQRSPLADNAALSIKFPGLARRLAGGE